MPLSESPEKGSKKKRGWGGCKSWSKESCRGIKKIKFFLLLLVLLPPPPHSTVAHVRDTILTPDLSRRGWSLARNRIARSEKETRQCGKKTCQTVKRCSVSSFSCNLIINFWSKCSQIWQKDQTGISGLAPFFPFFFFQKEDLSCTSSSSSFLATPIIPSPSPIPPPLYVCVCAHVTPQKNFISTLFFPQTKKVERDSKEKPPAVNSFELSLIIKCLRKIKFFRDQMIFLAKLFFFFHELNPEKFELLCLHVWVCQKKFFISPFLLFLLLLLIKLDQKRGKEREISSADFFPYSSPSPANQTATGNQAQQTGFQLLLNFFYPLFPSPVFFPNRENWLFIFPFPFRLFSAWVWLTQEERQTNRSYPFYFSLRTLSLSMVQIELKRHLHSKNLTFPDITYIFQDFFLRSWLFFLSPSLGIVLLLLLFLRHNASIVLLSGRISREIYVHKNAFLSKGVTSIFTQVDGRGPIHFFKRKNWIFSRP